MSVLEIKNDEEEIKRALRDQTKTFFGLEKPLMHKYTKVVTNLDELIAQLHAVFSSDSVNIEWVRVYWRMESHWEIFINITPSDCLQTCQSFADGLQQQL